MDARFRHIQRAAQIAGRGTIEDLNYISIQRQMGLGISLITAAAEAGDASAQRWMAENGFLPLMKYIASHIPSHGTAALELLRSSEQFRATLFHLFNACVVPVDVIIKWIFDCTKRVLARVREARTGRLGLLFTVRNKEDLLVLAQTEDLLVEINRCHPDSDYIISPEKMEEYRQHLGMGIPLGIREHILTNLVTATLSLADVVSLRKAQRQRLRGWGQSEENTPGHPQREREWVHTLIAALADNLDQIMRHIISRSINPPPKTSFTITFTTYRQECLQDLADILLNREWNRPG